MRQSFLLFFVFSLVFFSCKKELEPEKLEGEKTILIGKWEWQYTTHKYNWCEGPTLNEIIEPEADLYSFVITEEGKVYFFENGKPLSDHIIVFDNFYNAEDAQVFDIHLDGNESERFLGRIWGDSIFSYDFPYKINEPGCEDYKSYFCRE